MTNKGELRWMGLDRGITAALLVIFLARLIREAGGKVLLILDRLPVHRGRAVQDWLAGRRSQIEVFLLPPTARSLDPLRGSSRMRG